jgi:hypothetical protein
VSLKEGIPFIVVGILLISTGSVFFWDFDMGHYALMSKLAFISAGLIFYAGWMQHFGKDNKEYYNNSGGKRVFLPPS